MKQWFFTFMAIGLPIVAFGGVIYLFVRGLYSVVADWLLGRELKHIREDSMARRRQRPVQATTPPVSPIVAIEESFGWRPLDHATQSDAPVLDLPDDPPISTKSTDSDARQPSKPEVAETTSFEPIVVEPEATEPEAVEPEAVELEAVELEAAEPEAVEPEAVEPEAAELEAVEPEAAELEAVEPEAVEPEAAELEAVEPEAAELEAVELEAAEPEAAEPETAEPETAEPEAAEPEATEPEAVELGAEDPSRPTVADAEFVTMASPTDDHTWREPRVTEEDAELVQEGLVVADELIDDDELVVAEELVDDDQPVVAEELDDEHPIDDDGAESSSIGQNDELAADDLPDEVRRSDS